MVGSSAAAVALRPSALTSSFINDQINIYPIEAARVVGTTRRAHKKVGTNGNGPAAMLTSCFNNSRKYIYNAYIVPHVVNSRVLFLP